MDQASRKQRIHDLDVTVWVGKNGLDPVVGELETQLDEAEFVKAKFLRAARGGSTTEDLAAELAERAGAELVRTRGHTAVFER
jgi:RNA-binding protein